MITQEEIKKGSRIKFPEFKYYWKVRAIDDRYAICTAYGGYTIIDFKNNVRGAGTSWSLGHRTDDEIEKSMLALNNQHPDGIFQEVSNRNRCILLIESIKY